jgi:hypothetical protein
VREDLYQQKCIKDRHKCLKLVYGILVDVNYRLYNVPVNCMTFPKVNKFMNCLKEIKYIRAYYNNVLFFLLEITRTSGKN